MPQPTNENFHSMVPERQADFITELCALVEEGEKGKAISRAKNAGIEKLPDDPNRLLAYLRSLSPQNRDDTNLIDTFPVRPSILIPPSNFAAPSPFVASARDRSYRFTTALLVDNVNALVRRTPDTATSLNYRREDGTGFGVSKLLRDGAGIGVVTIDVFKDRRVYTGETNVIRHKNFGVTFSYQNDSGVDMLVSYSPIFEHLDRTKVAGVRENDFFDKFSYVGPKLLANYPFSEGALLARLLDSSAALKISGQMADESKRNRLRTDRRVDKVLEGIADTGDARIIKPRYTPAAVEGKLVIDALNGLPEQLELSIDRLISSDDLKRLIAFSEDMQTSGINRFAGRNECWYVPPNS